MEVSGKPFRYACPFECFDDERRQRNGNLLDDVRNETMNAMIATRIEGAISDLLLRAQMIIDDDLGVPAFQLVVPDDDAD